MGVPEHVWGRKREFRHPEADQDPLTVSVFANRITGKHNEHLKYD